MKAKPTRTPLRREGYVLFAVLIVIVVLSLLSYRFTDAMTTEYRAAKRTADLAKVRAAAMSGINYVMDTMSNPSTFASALNSNALANNPNAFADVQVGTDPDNPNRQLLFSIVCVNAASTTGTYTSPVYGVIDEGGKININAWIAIDPSGNALYNMLYNPISPLPNMTPQIASNIVAWVSPANATPPTGAPQGAQTADYMALQQPYQAKNGPLNSLDELLLVQGVTPALLYGTDQNQNGIQDDGDGLALDRGWQDYLTVNGRELNVDSTGTLRINYDGDDLNGIYNAMTNAGIDQGMAAYIIAAKLYGSTPYPAITLTATATTGKGGTSGTITLTLGTPANTKTGTTSDLITAVQKSLQSASSSGKTVGPILNLQNTQVTLPAADGAAKDAPKTVVMSPLNDNNTLTTLLPSLLDKLTNTNTVEMTPRLNVATANLQVLQGLPGLTSSDVSSIATAQSGLTPGDPATTSGAWLVTQGGLSATKYKAISKYVTGSSLIYRVQAIGYYSTGGPMARIEAIVDTGLGYPRILYVRDLTSLDNPRGFIPPSLQALQGQ